MENKPDSRPAAAEWTHMSVGQRALWFEQLAYPARNAYNLGACLRFKRRIDPAAFSAALAQLTARHPQMRARFDCISSEPCWWIAGEPLISDAVPGKNISVETGRLQIAGMVLRPYDLAAEHPFRFCLVDLDDGGSLLGIGCHHIVSDLHSLVLMVRDLATAYVAVGTALPDSTAAASYAAFCEWQSDMLLADRGVTSAQFWRDRLANVPVEPWLGAMQSHTTSRIASAGRIDFRIEAETAGALVNQAAQAGTTPFVALLTTFQVLLAHRCQRSDIVVGTPASGRNEARFRNTVGYFVNLLPMVFDYNAAESFASALTRNGALVRGALAHGQFPFGAMVENMGPARTPGTTPWIQATLTFQKTVSGLEEHLTRLALGLPGGRLPLGGDLGELIALPEVQPQFPLGIAVAPIEGGFSGCLQFDSARIVPATAADFLEEWLALNAICAAHPEAAIGELLGQVAPLRQALVADNLLSAIDESIARYADRIAVSAPTGNYTFQALAQRSVAIAAKLQALGIGKGCRVAVVGNGGADVVPAMIGVLRCGAAFVPIDLHVGRQRIDELLQSARVSAVVSCADDAESTDNKRGIPVVQSQVDFTPSSAPFPKCAPLDPAWLMFTSGTTGTPKAAIVPHEAALAHARAIAQRFDLQAGDRVLQFASLSFDEHAEEIFPTLLAGACVVCLPQIRFQDPESLLRAVRDQQITVLHLPTSYWHLWMDEAAHQSLAVPETLRLVNAGGEQAAVARLRTWSQVMPRHIRWFNSYGLTEAAVTSLVFEYCGGPQSLQAMTRIPVGKPIAGTSVRIAQAEHESDGEELGELMLGGPGVGLGYLDNSEATRARFFHQGENSPIRWLRTGDLAYANADGDVVIVGRRDRVIKLRGARIEPAEIEAVLHSHPAVLECVLAMAVDEGARGDSGLDLHVVVREGHALSETDIRDFWRECVKHIPAPARIAFCSAIPRTSGRKPDFTKLLSAHTAARRHSLPASRGDALSDTVTAIFSRLLQQEPIDPAANFFALGGHSLLAMRLVAALRRELGVDFSISDFLSRPTLGGALALCRDRGATAFDQKPTESPAFEDAYQLSHAQRRAMTLATAAGDDGVRLSIALRIRGNIEIARVERAWLAVLTKYRLLSADISEAGNRESPVTADLAHVQQIGRVECSGIGSREVVRTARLAFARHAEHTAAVNAAILVKDDGEHILFIEARHSALDGGCVPLILDEFLRAYRTGTSDPRPGAASYRQFVFAERHWLASPAHASATAYWEDRLQDISAPTRLAAMAASGGSDFSSSNFGLTLGAGLQHDLLGVSRSCQCTPFAVLLAAFLVLASRQGGGNDLLIGVPVSLRDALGVEDVVGPTLNPLPFRATMHAAESFVDLVQRTRDMLSASFEHAALPYEEITGRCRALRGLPIPIQFVAQGGMRHSVDPDCLEIAALSEREGHCAAALLVGICVDDAIRVEFEYQRNTLSDRNAAALLKSYRILIGELVRNPLRSVAEARMLPQSRIAEAFAMRAATPLPSLPMLLHSGLEVNARLYPERPAIICGNERFTYGQLENLANRHAARLIASGVSSGDRVVIAAKKGVAEVVAALAILKVGAMYVPVAHDMPAARATLLIARVDARIATGAADLFDGIVGECGIEYLPVDLGDAGPFAQPVRQIDLEASAYILFTSGSSGEPKGVEVSHRAALGTIGEILRRFDIDEHDVFYGFSLLGFDLSVFDIFGAFCTGGCLVLPSGEQKSDAFVWVEEVTQHAVTIWNTVPSALDMLLDAAGEQPLPSLRRLLLSGDWIGMDLPDRARTTCPEAMFVALGGATEASIWSNCHIVDEVKSEWRSIPYGRALAGQSMFVLDPAGWPVPVGVPGEIHIGGNGLAKGYWNDTALSAEKFVTHRLTGERIYRTGDAGRHFPDGSIEFLGRIDRQIKLRGYRIEIGEVEVALSRYAGVRRAIVAPIATSGSGAPDCLAAYIQVHEGTPLDFAALRHHAEHRLPDYMRPTHYYLLATIPLTANGKLDWASFPSPDRSQGSMPAPVAEMFTDTERRVAGIWQELLPVFSSARNDDFFSRGGHSLLAVRLIAQARKEFASELSLSQWLVEPTIAHLARMIDAPMANDEPGESRPMRSVTALRGKVRLAQDIVFSPVRRDRESAVFLTGVTGLIGSRVLAEYLAHTNVELICLARRAVDGEAESRLSRLLEHRGIPDGQWRQRVRFVQGDLSQPRFGLSESLFASIADEVTTVFHIGAAVNLVASYEALEAANVGGTHEAIRLAAKADAALQYVSSVGVFPYGAGTVIYETDAIDAPGQLLTGYCQSKWVAEQTVRLAVSRGLRATIYRPGLTLGERASTDAHDILSMLLSLSQKIGALPVLDMPIDLVTADYAASAMTYIARNPESIGGTFHLTHPQPVNLPDLFRRFEHSGRRIPTLLFGEWQAQLVRILPELDEPGVLAIGALIAGQAESDIAPGRIDCSRTCAMLRESSIRCDAIETILGRSLIDSTVSAGMLDGTSVLAA